MAAVEAYRKIGIRAFIAPLVGDLPLDCTYVILSYFFFFLMSVQFLISIVCLLLTRRITQSVKLKRRAHSNCWVRWPFVLNDSIDLKRESISWYIIYLFICFISSFLCLKNTIMFKQYKTAIHSIFVILGWSYWHPALF